jgi:Endo-alpha-N-acetylgalactosaminidase
MINRRKFLSGTAGLAGWNALSAIAGTSGLADPTGRGETIRSAPSSPLVLRSAELSVTFDQRDGLPYRYQIADEHIWGEDAGQPISAILCRLQPRSYLTLPLTPSSVSKTAQAADFSFDIAHNNQPAASFHLRYVIDGLSMEVTMENVVEHPGFELIEVGLPNLATVREEDGPSWMAHGRDGGELVELQHAKDTHLPDDPYFGRLWKFLPVAMVGGHRVGAVMEVTAFMDATEAEISGPMGKRHAKIGTVQTFRVDGGRCYNMNDGAASNCGNEGTPNLLVGQTPRCRFDFFHSKGPAPVDWLVGAKIVRQRMPTIPSNYYDDKLLFMIAGKYKTEAKPRTTFAQSEMLIRDIAMLTDHAPQVALVSGWVYDGQDTGYPSEDKVNDSLGGYDGFMRLKDEGTKYNANVSVNVNYDDAYRSSPLFDPAFIARRPDGKLWESRAWFGETSYIVGLAKYMQGGWGQKRIDFTLSHYGIKDAILIDALSWYAIRSDWDPNHPASGYKNLVDGRFEIIEEFRKRGVYVVSEQLRYPYIGKLSLSVDGVQGGHASFGGAPIPLVATIYRKSAIWGGDHDSGVQQNLFYNCRPGPWYNNTTNRADIADFYFLTVLPLTLLRRQNVETYQSHGTQRRLGLENNSWIEIDTATDAYTAGVNGVAIASNHATFCPIDDDRIAFYTREARRLNVPVPAGWDAHGVKARALFLDRQESHPLTISSGNIVVDVPARRPVIVYRQQA